MNTLKLHDLETSSIFWELQFLMTEKDVVNLLRIVTLWFGLTKTDLGRKALEIDCPEIFKESLIFSNRLRKQLHENCQGRCHLLRWHGNWRKYPLTMLGNNCIFTHRCI